MTIPERRYFSLEQIESFTFLKISLKHPKLIQLCKLRPWKTAVKQHSQKPQHPNDGAFDYSTQTV